MVQDKELERRRKISATLKGRSPWNKGLKNWRVTSVETRRKIGDKHRGKKVVVSEETRRKISQTLKGRTPKNLETLHSKPRSLEWRKNTGKSNTGLVRSEETRRKISEAKRNPLRPLYLAVRYCYKSKDWRVKIFHRDNYTCVICEKRGDTLNADHYPKRFVDILRDNGIDTIDKAMACEELWNIQNGRTLCLDCHKKTDTYGFKYKRTGH